MNLGINCGETWERMVQHLEHNWENFKNECSEIANSEYGILKISAIASAAILAIGSLFVSPLIFLFCVAGGALLSPHIQNIQNDVMELWSQTSVATKVAALVVVTFASIGLWSIFLPLMLGIHTGSLIRTHIIGDCSDCLPFGE